MVAIVMQAVITSLHFARDMLISFFFFFFLFLFSAARGSSRLLCDSRSYDKPLGAVGSLILIKTI